MLMMLSCGFVCTSLGAFSLPIELTAAEIEYQGVSLTGIHLQTVEEGIRLTAAQAGLDTQPDLKATSIALSCAQLGNGVAGWCPGGEWQVLLGSADAGWEQNLQGTVAAAVWNDQQQTLSSSLLAGKFIAALQFKAAAAESELVIKWAGQALDTLPFKGLLPAQLDWIKAGKISGQASLVIPVSKSSAEAAQPGYAIRYELGLADISMDSPGGRFAAEALDLQAEGQWQSGTPSLLALDVKFLTGEVLADRFYTAFGPHTLQLKTHMALTGERIDIRDLQLSDGSVLRAKASGSLSLSGPVNSLKYKVQQLNMQFPMAYERYLEPVLAAWTLDKLTVTGGVGWTGSGEGSGFPSGMLVFEDLSVVDHSQNRFAFTGMSAQVEVGASSGVSDFSWQGLLLGRINLGAGKINLNTAPGLFQLAAPLKLAVLGGEFVIDEFSLELPEAGAEQAEPVVHFNAGLNAMDMEQLTAALGWPTFAGKISGRIPGASLDNGVLTVDGLLSFEAFDGQIQLSNLRVERLFGVLPSFAANLDIDNLDLQMLTSAFSFGQIAGRLDGYVHELRMLDWSPVSFDAWIGTPERQTDSKNISRRAVNNLTSIGGGGATAALTGPIMRLFSSFSYKRLGMGCRLENYVCAIRGLADEDNSVLIMEGSGIPKLSIRVFNRRMDWPQLVSNLTAASAGEEIRIGDP